MNNRYSADALLLAKSAKEFMSAVSWMLGAMLLLLLCLFTRHKSPKMFEDVVRHGTCCLKCLPVPTAQQGKASKHSAVTAVAGASTRLLIPFQRARGRECDFLATSIVLLNNAGFYSNYYLLKTYHAKKIVVSYFYCFLGGKDILCQLTWRKTEIKSACFMDLLSC